MPYTRISARKGATVRLNVSFFANGVLADPWSIRKIRIYKNTDAEENLVAEVDISTTDYPSPIVQEEDSNGPVVGKYYYDLDVPDSFAAPDTYIDKWFWIGDELTGTDFDINDESYWDSKCNQFFIVPSNTWYADDGLIIPRIAFEALDKDLVKPSIQTIEVGLMPIPLYDYDYERVAPLMAQLNASISIETLNCESIVTSAPMTIGLRQGTHRSNPFVAQYRVDTNTYLKGTYRYRVSLAMPNGEVKVSPALQFTVR